MSITLPSVDNEMPSTSSLYPPKQRKEALISAELNRNDMLPEIHSNVSIIKTKPLSTSMQSSFIPEDILSALTQPSHNKEKLGAQCRNFSHSPPASIWNYKRRNRFKHLLEHTPCVCGAGKDISFLYDVSNSVPHPPKSDPLDQSHVRNKDETSFRKPESLVLPDSVIPEEYHVVKSKGVVGIQFHEDKYSIQSVDHEKHLTLFPSMNPTSRFEVIQLRNTFENMMDKAGINDLETDVGIGSTQMHTLLKLIKKEQNIYNIVFNELIRQTTVECAERGELLHLVWNKYHQLLNKVPEQIMSLHEEVIAQRALDLRLTDELMRFKGTIGTLTSELTDVKEHDKKVTKEAKKAQEDLRSALAESQKNASLLAEYHDLYELQRQRLERQVFMLSEEKEIWSTAAYSLAIKVTEEYKLNTAKRLQLLEKSWVKLASHFTILLSDRDTDLLTKIQGHIEKWRDLLEDMNLSLQQREDRMKDNIKPIQTDVQNYLIIFKQKYIDLDNGVVKIPDEDFVRPLIASVKSWLESVVREADTFSGVMLLNSREELSRIRREIEEWTDNALKMFGRHCGIDNKVHSDQISMLTLNKEADQLLKQLHDRTTGENGIANMIIHLQGSLEIWEARLTSSALGILVFQESEWGNFYHVLEDWLQQLNQAIECIGVALNIADGQEEQSNFGFTFHDVIKKTQKWATKASNSIDSEDAKLVKQVSSLHSEMVRWMIQVLLRLAHDMKGNSQEAAEMALLGSASIEQLTEVANTLFEFLETFSNYVALCCDGIVIENTLKKQDNNEENADYELNELKRLRTECADWIQTAQMLLSQATGVSVKQLFPSKTSTAISERSEYNHYAAGTLVDSENLQSITKEKVETEKSAYDDQGESKTEQETSEITAFENEHSTITEADSAKEGQNLSPQTDNRLETSSLSMSKIEEEKRIEVLGADANTHRQTIMQSPDQRAAKFGTGGSSDTRKAFEALAAVETLQDQLIATEERAQLAEERVNYVEAEIIALEERIRVLEKQLEKQHEQMDCQSAAASKSSSTATTAIKSFKANLPMSVADVREEKSGRKSGKSSNKSSKRS